MNIGYFGDGPWAHQAFRLLAADPDITISFLVPRADTPDRALIEIAERSRIPICHESKINSDEFYAWALPYDCDLFVSMSFNQIFKPRIMNLPRLKTINCHAGKLPFYRGRNVLNWVLINNEKEFGITVHYVDEGIDTGDIILQETFPISDDDDYSTLLEVAYQECANLLYQAITLLKAGNVKTRRQESIHPTGFYCGQRGSGDEEVYWNQSSREIFDFVRAICKPGPMATTYLDNSPVRINKVSLIPGMPEYKGNEGQVIGINSQGVVVKTADSAICIVDYISDLPIRTGDRFHNIMH